MHKLVSILEEETNTGESNLMADLFGFKVIRTKECKCKHIKTSDVLLNALQL